VGVYFQDLRSKKRTEKIGTNEPQKKENETEKE
jgi:hypothetical protein